MSKIGEIAGVNVYLSSEQYKEYKGTLNKQIEELHQQLQQKENIIKEVREYIEENNYHCKNQVEQEQYDKELLEILDKVGDNYNVRERGV